MSTVELGGHTLSDPIAVFDAGIGSYSAVAHIQRQFPDQDLLYLADRASFPYGAKTLPELRQTIERTLDFLESLSVAAIVLASNVPSVTVLDEVLVHRGTTLIRVVPPVKEALVAAGDGDVVVLGVHSLVTSAALMDYLGRQVEVGSDRARVHVRDASALVELVESGDFLFDSAHTQRAVTDYLDVLCRELPAATAATLSSTHLPWLQAYIHRARPELTLLDPIESVVAGLTSLTRPGTGTVLGLVTETPEYPASRFTAMLARLGVRIPLMVADIPR